MYLIATIRPLIASSKLLLIIFHLISVDDADNSSYIEISSPGWTTANAGDNGKIQWVVIAGSFSNYTISKARSSTLDSNTYHTFDISKGIITLYFNGIQTSNAGYYSLTVAPDPLAQKFVGKLFVYDVPSAKIVQTVGNKSASYVGDTIELNCIATSRSQPIEMRPNIFYYFWHHFQYGDFQNISGGQVILSNGDPLPGYRIKNGSTLVIDSLQAADGRGLTCAVQEYGFSILSYTSSVDVYHPPYFEYPPFGYWSFPPNRRLNVDTNFPSLVYLYFYYLANPPVTTWTNWTLLNRTGYRREFPTKNNPLQDYFELNFWTPNAENYGSYSMTMRSNIFSTTTTYQVTEAGPPDTPANLTVLYTTHDVICLKWRCQSGNYYSFQKQTVSVKITDAANNLEIDSSWLDLEWNCDNLLYITIFQTDIQPETMYEASIWSTNQLGSSNISIIEFKTPKRISLLNVTSETISIVFRTIIQSDALINVTSAYPAIAWLNVTCCAIGATLCSVKSYNVFNSLNQIVFDNLPDGDEFVFDFTLFNGDFFNYVYTLALVKGVHATKMPRNGANCDISNDQVNHDAEGIDEESPLLLAMIILAVLLGVSVLTLIGCLAACVVTKNHSRRLLRNLEQRTTAGHSDYVAQEETDDENYEHTYESEQYNHQYTQLEESSPKPP